MMRWYVVYEGERERAKGAGVEGEPMGRHMETIGIVSYWDDVIDMVAWTVLMDNGMDG
jgi:hypothetical protein